MRPWSFAGVQLGTVDNIGLAPLGAPDAVVSIPVVAKLDRAKLRELLGDGANPAALAARGAVARLATQSLLTGQLYVDIDMDPARAPGAAAEASPALPDLARDPAEIPTAASPLQALQTQLATMDLARLGQDLGATSHRPAHPGRRATSPAGPARPGPAAATLPPRWSAWPCNCRRRWAP